MTAIIGAGLAGMLAGSIFQRAKLFEAGPEEQCNHKAVLRFRSSAVGEAIGVEFRKVLVHKGIFHDGRFVQPDIRYANLYSKKVINRLADRSIWKVEPAERYVAPEDLLAQMAERCTGRIEWGHKLNKEDLASLRRTGPVVSTIPMPLMMEALDYNSKPSFSYAPITVKRWRVAGADTFQTIYFPSPETNLYRASITGDLLIAEFINAHDEFPLHEAFGLSLDDITPLEQTKQRYGKIAPIDERARRNFIHTASVQHNVFSVGRFATWRNLLLDDVLHDIHVVKRLITADNYSVSQHAAR